jgi:hypothetical protein
MGGPNEAGGIRTGAGTEGGTAPAAKGNGKGAEGGKTGWAGPASDGGINSRPTGNGGRPLEKGGGGPLPGKGG